MAHIVIKDLLESTELDRQAMLAIAGGSRYRARSPQAAGVVPAKPQRIRLYDLAPPRPPSR